MAKLIQQFAIPSFSVNKGGVNQTLIVSGAFQLITWSTLVFDTFGDFNLSTERFQPKTPGKYLLIATISMDNLTIPVGLSTRIIKNGTEFYNGNNEVTSAGFNDPTRTMHTVVTANGTTDYFEVYVMHGDASPKDVVGATYATYFMGFRVGS